MCGIAGIINFGNRKIDCIDKIQKMSRTLRHRGPDGEGYLAIHDATVIAAYGNDTPADILNSTIYHKPTIHVQQCANCSGVLAHRRLRIIDISPTGYQPLCSADKRLWIVYNGEIYNYIELKIELQNAGFLFYTNSDTEVVLHSYSYWGNECVKKFNGMWSFTILDLKKNLLFASRDRFGVKPFYYHLNDSFFSFASEQKAFLAASLIDFMPVESAVFDYWFFSKMEEEEQSMFEGITELLPSNSLSLDINSGKLTKWRYYILPYSNVFLDKTIKFDEAAENIRSLTLNAVNIRLRSDVEVGSCLSGGLDSSSIVSCINTLTGKGMSTFTASFSEPDIDESGWAKIVTESTHSIPHYTIPTSGELLDDIKDLIYCQDIPIWSTSTYAQYRVMKLIKDAGLKVALDGQGGDELFAGYNHYQAFYLNDVLHHHGIVGFLRELNQLNGTFAGKQFIKQFVVKNNLNNLPQSLHLYLMQAIQPELNYLNPTFIQRNSYRLKEQGTQIKTLQEALYSDFNNSLLKSYLKCEDRCSMWHSVESRTPFSDDTSLIEFVFNLPSSFKIGNGHLKSIMRKAMKGITPDKILNRKDKKGYLTPNRKWIAEIRNELKYVFEEPEVKEYLNVKKIVKDYELLFNRPDLPDDGRIFKLIAFPLWLSAFSHVRKTG
jgi:asparagine synthase (glutamine-hydrolysing)